MSAPRIFQPDYYQRLYEIEETHWWAVGMRDVMDVLLRPALEDQPPLRVLDIGCGTGLLLQHLSCLAPAGEVLGLDYSPHALAYCQLRGASRLVLASAVVLPFADDSFDLLVCTDTLQHLSPLGADGAALREFARVLSPHGWLYLRTNSSQGHRALRGVDPSQYRRYDRAGLSALVREAGLTVERATYANCLPGAVAAVRELIAPGRPTTPAIGPGLSIAPPRWAVLNGILSTVMKAEARFIQSAELGLPFGHSIAILARK